MKPVLAAFVVIAIAVMACGGNTPSVLLVTEGAYPPYNFVDETGEVGGFERELGDELCRRAELDCEWATAAWEGMLERVAAGEYDAVITGVSITAERDALIDFTRPYLPPGQSLFLTRSDAGEDALEGAVGAQVATIHAAYLSQSGARLREYAATPELVDAVLTGAVDAALVSAAVARESAASHPGLLTVAGPALMLDGGVGIGVREGDGWLRERLNRAIAAMQRDGSLNALIRKWFGPEAPTF